VNGYPETYAQIGHIVGYFFKIFEILNLNFNQHFVYYNIWYIIGLVLNQGLILFRVLGIAFEIFKLSER
jgi:hypothetical protein